MFIQNNMQRAFYVPPSADERFPQVLVAAGDCVPVDSEHWDGVRKDNSVIDALLAGRYLVVTNSHAIANVQLSNPAKSAPPAELSDTPEGVQVIKGKVETQEIDLGDEPAEAPRRGRKAG